MITKFFQKQSRLFIVVTYCFILALFADGSNITDLFSDSASIHFEEGDGSNLFAASGVSPNSSTPSYKFFKSQQQKGYSTKLILVPKRVFVDQDSPSLDAVSTIHSLTSFLIWDETVVLHSALFSNESIYIQNCSLLI